MPILSSKFKSPCLHKKSCTEFPRLTSFKYPFKLNQLSWPEWHKSNLKPSSNVLLSSYEEENTKKDCIYVQKGYVPSSKLPLRPPCFSLTGCQVAMDDERVYSSSLLISGFISIWPAITSLYMEPVMSSSCLWTKFKFFKNSKKSKTTTKTRGRVPCSSQT